MLAAGKVLAGNGNLRLDDIACDACQISNLPEEVSDCDGDETDLLPATAKYHKRMT